MTTVSESLIYEGLIAVTNVRIGDMRRAVHPGGVEEGKKNDDAHGVELAKRIERHAHDILKAVERYRTAYNLMQENKP